MSEPHTDRERVLLGLLHSVEQDGTRSQRHMASEFDIALGLVNTYLKFCVRKGYVKVKRIPARRYAYFLTPKGLAEKSRLTVAHLSYSLSFFRQAREDCDHVFRLADARGWRRIALCGAGELAEIASLCADNGTTQLVGILDGNAQLALFRGLPVVRSLDDLPAFDAVLVTDQSNPQAVYDQLVAQLGAERVLPLGVLRISAAASRMAG